MSLEPIFRTERGIYQVNPDTGIFTVKDIICTPKFILGCLSPRTVLEPDQDSLFKYNHAYVPFFALDRLIAGKLVGFSLDFVVGNYPFGIVCTPADIREVSSQRLVFGQAFMDRFDQINQQRSDDRHPVISLELSSANPILEVYRQLKPEERPYLTH